MKSRHHGRSGTREDSAIVPKRDGHVVTDDSAELRPAFRELVETHRVLHRPLISRQDASPIWTERGARGYHMALIKPSPTPAKILRRHPERIFP